MADCPIFVVDCGSQGSRVYRYTPTGTIAPTKLAALPALHEAMSQGGSQAFVDSLSDLMSTFPKSQVFVGATGGMRDALQVGTVSESDLRTFESSLQSALSRATFAVLSGEDEAAYEYRAVRFAVAEMKEAEAEAGNSCLAGVSMVSLGGASSQLAKGDVVLSACAGIKQAIVEGKAVTFRGLVAAHGPQDAVAAWKAAVRVSIKDGLPLEQPLGGTVVGISTLYWAAKECSVDTVPVARAEALGKVRAHLAAMSSDSARMEKMAQIVAEKKKPEKGDACNAVSGVILLECLIDLVIGPDAVCIFRRVWGQEDNTWITNYACGKVLELRESN